MEKLDIKIAKFLLQSKAIKLEPANPFTWASGWKSPIYCDNRVTLSYPAVRNAIRDGFVEMIQQHFTGVDKIAGVATGAIAQAALVADAMNLPMAYVRSSAKSHGMQNLIEGEVKPGERIVVIEDLISTGGSSLKAVQALREAGCEVLGMCAIFSYGFQVAEANFKNADCKLFTQSNYNTLVSVAAEIGYIQNSDIDVLKQWRANPEEWGK